MIPRTFGDAFVYRCMSADGRVLYVGMTANRIVRMRNHKSSKAWWPEVDRVVWTEAMPILVARRVEKALIRSLRPLHNVQFNERRAA